MWGTHRLSRYDPPLRHDVTTVTNETARSPVRISVRLGNIVRQADCDAIVNSANQNLRAGSGVCGAIHAAAGPELEAFSHRLAPLQLGAAVATPGFRLPNRAVIHVRGPKYHFDEEPALHLAKAMRSVLLLADQQQLHRIAVPAISMGVYAYPPDEAVPILVQTAFQVRNELRHVQEICFVVIDTTIRELFEARIARLEVGDSGALTDESVGVDVSGKLITPDLINAIRRRYSLSWSGIHGVSHWSRVRRNGLRIAAVNGARTDVVELFAFLHDSCREHDGRDPDHGHRAAEFAATLRGHFLQIDDAGFSLLCEAMEHHSKGFLEADPTVQACWDADRLDLVRLGITPEPDRLCTEAARRMVSFSSQTDVLDQPPR